jgi:hypothetical protein
MVPQQKRRLFLGLGLVVALALAVSPASASAASGSFAVGGGWLVSGGHFAFSAHCKSATGTCLPSGTVPSGHAVVRDPGPFGLGEAQGHVCAYQTTSSNSAKFWINVEKGSGNLGSFPVLVFEATNSTGTLPDVLHVAETSACGAASTGGSASFVDKGNIVVKNR